MRILKIIGKFLTFIFTLGLFACFLAVVLIKTTHNLVTKDNLARYIKDANILDIKANVLLDVQEEVTVKEKITEMALEIGIPKEIVKDILKSEELTELLGEFFSRTLDYVINGGIKPTLSEETVNKMVTLALESSANHINVVLEDEVLEKYTLEYTVQIGNLIPDRLEIIENETIYTHLYNILNFDIIYLYIVIAICTIFIGIFTWTFYKPVKCIGFAMMFAGIVFVIFGSSNGILNGFMTSQIAGMKDLISPLITNILTLWFKSGVIVSFAGVFLLVLYSIISRILKHSRMNQAEF